jgi:hypothetical protein
MSKQRLWLPGIAMVWLVVLAIVVMTSLDRLSAPSWGNAIGGNLSAEVTEDSQVGQAFTAPLPGLHRIEVALVRPKTNLSYQLTFHLKSAPEAAEDLWSATLTSDAIQNNQAYGFQFPPMRDSRGQTFYFYLDSVDPVPGEAVTVRYGPSADLEGASAYVNHQPIAGNLVFRSYYALGPVDKIEYLLDRMAEGRPYILGTKGFYIGLATVYALVLVAFLLQIAKVILKEAKEEV